MSAPAFNPESGRIDTCDDCDSPTGGTICGACAKENATIAAQKLLERFKYTAPGLTNAELALLGRFVTELEGP